jgi:hypothetical protein
VDKDILITGTICFPISICALGTGTHNIFLTTEPNLCECHWKGAQTTVYVVLEVSESLSELGGVRLHNLSNK